MSLNTLIKEATETEGLRYAIVADKIRRELGWQPRYDFPEGLADTLRWYREHRSWWEKIRSGTYRDYYERMYGAGGRYRGGA